MLTRWCPEKFISLVKDAMTELHAAKKECEDDKSEMDKLISHTKRVRSLLVGIKVGAGRVHKVARGRESRGGFAQYKIGVSEKQCHNSTSGDCKLRDRKTAGKGSNAAQKIL
jgi:hypothetical protein